jgi:hypothetical protein
MDAAYRVKYALVLFNDYSDGAHYQAFAHEDAEPWLEKECERIYKELQGEEKRRSVIDQMPLLKEVGEISAQGPSHATSLARLRVEQMLTSDKFRSDENKRGLYMLKFGEAIPMTPLDRFIYSEVRERFDRENYRFLEQNLESEFLAQHGFGPNAKPKPAPLPNPFPAYGSIIQYKTGFPQQITPLILNVSGNEAQARVVMDRVFSRIDRHSAPVTEGDTACIDWGEVIGTAYHILTEPAFSTPELGLPIAPHQSR